MAKKVPADVAQVMLLDKLIEKIDDLAKVTGHTEELMQRMIPEGIVEPIKTVTVTDNPQVIEPPYLINGKRWFSVKITNDGPNIVYAIINSGVSGNTPREIRIDETYGVEFKTAIIRDVYLYCGLGETSSVRITGVR